MAAPGLKHLDYEFGILSTAAQNWHQRQSQREENKIKTALGRIDEVETPERIAANQRFKQEANRRRSERKLLEQFTPPAALINFAQERVVGNRDFLGVEFLEMAMAVARFVGRVNIRERPGVTLGFGTGFVVSPRLFLTNNHVLPNPEIAQNSEVEFDYQKDRFGRPLPIVIHALDPKAFFLTDPKLDFTLVAVGETSRSGSPLKNYAWLRLQVASGKALFGDSLNIIQHPHGEMKQLVLRSNKLVDTFNDLVHYEADTEPGSSGSPVFSDLWDVVALHHSGVPKTNAKGQLIDVDGRVWVSGQDDPDRLAWNGNEGIRVSSIVKFVEQAELDTLEKKELRRQFLEDEPPNPIEHIMNPIQPLNVVTPPSIAGGSITVTIPLHITVALGSPIVPGAAIAQPLPPTPVPTSNGAVASPKLDTAIDSSILTPQKPDTLPKNPPSFESPESSILDAAKRELGSREDVLSVELGYVFKNSWITDERALVVTRSLKRKALKMREAGMPELPNKFQGLPVEVTNPSIEDLVRLARGTATAEAAFKEAVVLGQEITYNAPTGISLTKVTGKMHVVAHVSPDAGWTQLKKFLGGTRKQLVVGMYDFGAPHIVDTLIALEDKSTFQKLTLAIQKGESVGEGTKADDLHDDEVIEKLEDAFGSEFEHAWVKTGRTNGWVSSSYHIKVAVRDQKAFWLSSGNWQSSNQPQADPLSEEPPERKWLDNYNREWHAIVEHEGLAKTFEAYLLNDYKNNLGTDGQEELVLPDLLIPGDFFVPETAEADVSFNYFQPFDANRTFTVLPLLTPDNYHEHVLELIESAQEELLIQNQTFNAPKPEHTKLQELVRSVLDKQKKGVKVKVIFRLLDPTKARKNLQELKEMGFDMKDFRLQKNCHTKGIVVDRKRVLLGSQNWSNDGVSVNRDASLLFDDEELAGYFATIFDHDWRVLAKQSIGSRSQPLEWASASAATPEGMIRLTWKDYMEMQ
jgi:V8-like Glu-specific endopeptidase